MASDSSIHVQAVITEVGGAKDDGTTLDDKPLIAGMAEPFAIVDVHDSATLLGVVAANGQGFWSLQLTTPLLSGAHDFSVVQSVGSQGSAKAGNFVVTVDAHGNGPAPYEDAAIHARDSVTVNDHTPFFPPNLFKVRAGQMPAGMGDPHPEIDTCPAFGSPAAPPFARETLQLAHGHHVETIALLGHQDALDLSSIAPRPSGAQGHAAIGSLDLGGHHNALKLSLADTRDLGGPNLFIDDGKKQLMVKGKDGDSVDLANSPMAGLPDGEWTRQGTAQIDGLTFNLIEHSSEHTELLVQQSVRVEFL